jgi:ketosteroid isomerase-like protein
MSQDNVELVRLGHEAFRNGGEEALFAYFDVDVDLRPIEETPGVESYLGHEGVRRYFEVTRDAFGEFGWDPLEFVDVGDHVLVATRFYAEGRGSGLPVEAIIYNVFTVREGKVVRIRGSLDRSKALEAAGLRE